jgi:ATP-binding cassette subfamily C (CFTR/MRP) protein 1
MGSAVDAVLVCVGSSYMALTIPVLLACLYMVGKYYLKTSRPLRMIDLEAKSPLFSLFTETVDGIETIRAFRWQDKFQKLALDRLENSQQPYYLMMSVQRWLNLVLDLMSAGMGLTVLLLAFSMPWSTDPGRLGISLSMILSFNAGLNQLISMWTHMEIQIASLTRTRTFAAETPNENDRDTTADPAITWPTGNIHVANMTVKFEDGTVALQNMSLDIKAGQKIGICGRTGSGKSTLVSVLVRLLDPTTGQVSVDGQDITSIQRKTARESIIVLPQEVMVFPRSFAFNINSEGRELDESVLVEILHKVGLWDLVEARGGLEGDLDPSGLSQGEKQLLALARALVRKHLLGGRCILVLDEATSSLDDKTQNKFQEIIDSDFKSNTVISVAHRLEVVKDVDLIVVLEKGIISKIGTPGEVMNVIDLSSESEP